MCGGERDWLIEENERVLPGLIRMLLGPVRLAFFFLRITEDGDVQRRR
jgi:hypothetical protein